MAFHKKKYCEASKFQTAIMLKVVLYFKYLEKIDMFAFQKESKDKHIHI